MAFGELQTRWRQALLLPDLQAMAVQVQTHVPAAAARVLVGFSGGKDSTALALAAAVAARERALQITLVHINHQLQSDAPLWVEQCRKVAAGAGIELVIRDVDVVPAGMGLEAAARAARYAAIAQLMHSGDVVLTAHHQRDQAETVLLRLLRGAGIDGLGAMRHCQRFGTGWLSRPLLGVSAQRLSDVIQASGLPWIDDPSNADTDLDRVFMRERVLPLLRTRWAGADQVLARTAGLSLEASTLVQSVGADLLPEVAGLSLGTLSRSALARLPRSATKVVLRAWLKRQADVVLDARHTEALCQLLTDMDASMPAFAHAGVDVRCYGDEVFVLPPAAPRDPGLPCAWALQEPLRLTHGQLRATHAVGSGLSCERVAARAVTVRYRREGERVEFGRQRHHRVLKKQFQHWRVPPWQRDRLPLVCVDDEVVCVPGYMTVDSFVAGPEQDGWMIDWEPAPARMVGACA
jgi:tRNA(Ile)-lysidine synthase